MLALESGEAIGTIGGGAAEYRAMELARQMLAEKRSGFASYSLSAGEAADLGMICGGSLRLYLQYFDPARRDLPPVLQTALELLSGPQAAWLVTAISPDGSWRMGTFDRQNGLRGLPGVSPADVEPLLGRQAALSEGEPVLYVEPLNQTGTVYVFGAGHVGR